MASARPQSTLRAPTVAAAPSSNLQLTPSVEIAAALASTMARRSLKVVAAVGPSPAFASKANGHVIKANGRFIKANGRFIKADGRFIKGSFDALQGQVRVWDLGFRVIEYCFAYSVPAGTVPREGRPLGQLHSCWRFIGNSLDLLPGR